MTSQEKQDVQDHGDVQSLGDVDRTVGVLQDWHTLGLLLTCVEHIAAQYILGVCMVKYRLSI